MGHPTPSYSINITDKPNILILFTEWKQRTTIWIHLDFELWFSRFTSSSTDKFISNFPSCWEVWYWFTRVYSEINTYSFPKTFMGDNSRWTLTMNYIQTPFWILTIWFHCMSILKGRNVNLGDLVCGNIAREFYLLTISKSPTLPSGTP